MKALIIKFRQKIVIAVVLLSLPALAQEPTDKEIGFDREKVKKELYQENAFFRKELIDGEIEKMRKSMVDNYNAISSFNVTNPWTPIPTTGCENMGFDNNTAGWAMYWSNNDYNTTNLPSDNANNLTFSQMGSASTTGVAGVNAQRIAIVNPNINDLVLGQVTAPKYVGDKILRIGEPSERWVGREEVSKKFTLTPQNNILKYSYAVVLNDTDHNTTSNPYFKVTISVKNDYGIVTLPNCVSRRYDADLAQVAGFETSTVVPSSNGVYRFKRWETNIINLAQYVDLSTNPVVTISFSISDCIAYGNYHEAWAYVEAECLPSTSSININTSSPCIDSMVGFTAPDVEVFGTDVLSWNIYLGDQPDPIATYSGASAAHTFTIPGVYLVEYKILRSQGECDFVYTRTIHVKDCDAEYCEYCASFNPLKGEKYIISGWVKEQNPYDPYVQVKTYPNTAISVSFVDINQQIIGTVDFIPQSDIIDGWQRIQGEFLIPEDIDDLIIDLKNSSGNYQAFFDDIRVFPFNGSMKSFVYDPATQRLMAELDENNYATFYEYDNEGGLVRVKKETSAGIKTIQETRSGNDKKQD